MKDHYIICFLLVKVIDVRSEENLLAKVDWKTVHIVSETVYDVNLAAGCEHKLYLAVCIVVNLSYRTAHLILERNSPKSLSILFLETDCSVLVLVQKVCLAGSAVLHLEWSLRDYYGRISLNLRSFRLHHLKTWNSETADHTILSFCNGKDRRAVITALIKRLQSLGNRICEYILMSGRVLAKGEICDQRSFGRKHILLTGIRHIFGKIIFKDLVLYVHLDCLHASGNDPSVHVSEARLVLQLEHVAEYRSGK